MHEGHCGARYGRPAGTRTRKTGFGDQGFADFRLLTYMEHTAGVEPAFNRFTVLTRKKHIKSFACKQKKRISHKVCRTGIFLGVEPEYHRANIKCVFSSELKMRRNREENKAVPINLF